jgi:tetratricopeptide (TPR) repeat protein
MKYPEALLMSDQFIVSYPKSPFGYVMKGHIFNRMNRVNEALHYYREGLALINPKHHRNKAILYGAIGDLYSNLNELENAIDFYNRALKEDGDLSSLYMLDIARLYIIRDELKEAEEIYNDATKRMSITDKALQAVADRNRGILYSKSAIIAFQLRKDAEALAHAIKYENLGRNDTSKLFLATYFAQLGFKDKALQIFNDIDPGKCDLLMLAGYYLSIGNKAAAIVAFNKSYAQQTTREQLKMWKVQWQQKLPRDVWNSVREEEWYKSKVYK